MADNTPKVNVDILIVKKDKILLGLLNKKWNHKGAQVYGVPGRDIRFGEKISDTVRRNIKEEFNCNMNGCFTEWSNHGKIREDG